MSLPAIAQNLAEMALTLQQVHGLEEAVAAVSAQARRWFGVDRSVIMLLEGEELVVRAAEGPGAADLLGRRTPVSDPQSLDVAVLRQRSGLYVNDLPRSPYAHYPAVRESGAEAILLVPLMGTQGVLGVLSMAKQRRGSRFTATTLERAGILAAQAGIALENARLHHRLRAEGERVTGLLGALERLTKSHDLPTLLAELNRIGAEMCRCDRGATFLWDPKREVFSFGSTYGDPAEIGEALSRLEFARKTVPLVDRVLAGEPFVLSSASALRLLPYGFPAQPFGASAVIPLLTERTIQGAMTLTYADQQREFTAEQLWMLGGVAGYAAVAIERARLIAREREAAATAEALVQDLRRANRLKSDFLSTISHELRTPLNAIMGYTDLLREQAMGPLHAEQMEALDIVSKKSMQLLELINTTLDVTRLESGQVRIDVSEFSLPELVEEIRQELADEVQPLVDFRCRVAPELPLLKTDRAKLKTVVRNLAHNALKFTRRGHVELHAALAPDPACLQVTVSDSGIGIAPEDVQAIFEMFRQLEPAATRRFGGVGLGLYIVQRLLDLIGGSIEVKSQVGVGSTFRAVVPARYLETVLGDRLAGLLDEKPRSTFEST